LVAGINWIINAKNTDIRQRSFAFCGPVVCHCTGSNSSWKPTILDSNEWMVFLRFMSRIQMWPLSLRCCLAGYKKLLVLFFFRCVLSYLDWPSARECCVYHFCLWGKIIHSLHWRKLGLGPGFAEAVGVLSAEDFSPLSRVVFGTKSCVNTGRQVRI